MKMNGLILSSVEVCARLDHLCKIPLVVRHHLRAVEDIEHTDLIVELQIYTAL